MYYDMDLLDALYDQLWQSRRLADLLGNPQTPVERNEKIRREITPVKLVTVDKLNFISIYFAAAVETNNVYVTRGFLNVDYFTRNREEFRAVQDIVRRVFERNYLIRAGFFNDSSFTKGIFCYTERYRPLVFA